jgi:hypothetical protein
MPKISTWKDEPLENPFTGEINTWRKWAELQGYGNIMSFRNKVKRLGVNHKYTWKSKEDNAKLKCVNAGANTGGRPRGNAEWKKLTRRAKNDIRFTPGRWERENIPDIDG